MSSNPPQMPGPGYRRPPQPGYLPPKAVHIDETAALRHQLMGPAASSVPADAEPAAVPDSPPPRKPWFNRWTLGALLLLAGMGGIAGASAVSLLRIPNLPNCHAIFWPTASATTRLQCANAYVERGTVDDLLAAIQLVEVLPQDHPLRADIDERVEGWANQILDIANTTFQQGELDDAMRTARRIPRGTAAADEVSDRIAQWEEIWEQATSIYKESEGHLEASRFRDAFSAATQLRSVENRYWSTTRYEELVGLITDTRADVNALANAERLADGGTVEQVVEALAQVAAITEESYVHAEAQRVLKSLSRDLLDLAEDALVRANRAEAMDILSKIPEAAALGEEITDFRALTAAYELTWDGTTVGYESAIVRLQSLSQGRPLYARAQTLKRQWQRRLEAVAQFNWAKQIAQPGSVTDLRAAIGEARQIGAANPLWDDVQAQIQDWQNEIAEIEDRPFLDRAQVMASDGNRAALQAAIAEAKNVAPSSVLYDEAQEVIADWRWQVQKLDNGPVLAEAEQLAEAGRHAQAIAVASRIAPRQALYDEAQSAIADWQAQQEVAQRYEQAVLVSQPGTVDALVEAITLAQAIPDTSSDWELAQAAVEEWSWTLLSIAEATAAQNQTQGAAIAAQVPPRTTAYAEAQLKIREWQSVDEVGVPQ